MNPFSSPPHFHLLCIGFCGRSGRKERRESARLDRPTSGMSLLGSVLQGSSLLTTCSRVTFLSHAFSFCFLMGLVPQPLKQNFSNRPLSSHYSVGPRVLRPFLFHFLEMQSSESRVSRSLPIPYSMADLLESKAGANDLIGGSREITRDRKALSKKKL